MPILGLRASQELGIIKIVLNVSNATQSIINEHPALFKGLGCLKMPYKIQVDTSVLPSDSSTKESACSIARMS